MADGNQSSASEEEIFNYPGGRRKSKVCEEEIFNYPGGRRKSKVWNTFGFLKIKPGPPTKENLDMSRAICRLCRKSYVNKGISQ